MPSADERSTVMTMVLYELGAPGDLRYSQFSWRARMALALKGADVEFRPVAVSDKAAIAFSGQDKVPILVDGDRVVSDSWAIAEYLEAAIADYQSGTGGFLNVITAEQRALSTELALARARADSARRLAELERWVGGSVDAAVIPTSGEQQ